MVYASGLVLDPQRDYRTDLHTAINDVAAWKADPKKVAVGGGWSPGGPDHLLPMVPALMKPTGKAN